MSRGRFELSSMNTLLAFEATARLGSITLAAVERGTSHSAISRHIRGIEKTLGVVLFARLGRGVALTKSGETYFRAVQSGLDALHVANQEIRSRQSELTIGCTLEMSVVVLNPIVPALQRALGGSMPVRIVVCDYDHPIPLHRLDTDIAFEGVVGPHPNPTAVPLLREEIVPVAAPAFIERFGDALGDHPSTWRDVPRLDARALPGWATWNTWFDAHGCVAPPAPVEWFENHFNLLPAAENGDGLAIGWNGFMSGCFAAGRLVAVREAWLATELIIYGVPTPNGHSKEASRACLEALPGLIRGLTHPSPVAHVAEMLADGDEHTDRRG